MIAARGKTGTKGREINIMDTPDPARKSGYRLDFHDEFDGDALDGDRWVPYYLPQWSSREQSAPPLSAGVRD
jgi:hypothetical protein